MADYRRVASRYLRIATYEVAPSAEGDFFDNPEKREVREFAETGAITNEHNVASLAAPELDISKRKELNRVNQTPPTPLEIEDEPGGAQFSTLNRYIVETEEPVRGVPQGYEDLPKHPDIE